MRIIIWKRKGVNRMARRSIDVIGSGMMIVKKKIRKDLKGGKLGLRQIRRVFNIVTDEKLLCINATIASQMAGKKFGDLGAVQTAFKSARAKAKAECK